MISLNRIKKSIRNLSFYIIYDLKYDFIFLLIYYFINFSIIIYIITSFIKVNYIYVEDFYYFLIIMILFFTLFSNIQKISSNRLYRYFKNYKGIYYDLIILVSLILLIYYIIIYDSFNIKFYNISIFLLIIIYCTFASWYLNQFKVKDIFIGIIDHIISILNKYLETSDEFYYGYDNFIGKLKRDLNETIDNLSAIIVFIFDSYSIIDLDFLDISEIFNNLIEVYTINSLSRNTVIRELRKFKTIFNEEISLNNIQNLYRLLSNLDNFVSMHSEKLLFGNNVIKKVYEGNRTNHNDLLLNIFVSIATAIIISSLYYSGSLLIEYLSNLTMYDKIILISNAIYFFYTFVVLIYVIIHPLYRYTFNI